jgi:hypothetical protein
MIETPRIKLADHYVNSEIAGKRNGSVVAARVKNM